MSRDRNQSAEIQHTVVSPNDAMNSYIGDLLYSGTTLESDKLTESATAHESTSSTDHAIKAESVGDVHCDSLAHSNTSSDPQLVNSNNIKPGYSLIPLVSLERYRLDLSRPQRSKSASFLLLLWGLHLLRMPIAGRLRLSVFEHCRQRIMECRLLTDITQLPSAGGIRHE